MPKLFLSFLLLFTIKSFCQNSCDTIYWSESIKLSWSDFRGNPDTAVKFSAVSNPGIGYRSSLLEDSLKISTYCRFLTCGSWTKSNVPILLRHEQTHFDIAEYSRRLFIQKLLSTTYSFQDPMQLLDKIYLDFVKFRNELDKEYDLKTNYSRNVSMQDKWSSDIRSKITSLKNYAHAQLTIILKPRTTTANIGGSCITFSKRMTETIEIKKEWFANL